MNLYGDCNIIKRGYLKFEFIIVENISDSVSPGMDKVRKIPSQFTLRNADINDQ